MPISATTVDVRLLFAERYWTAANKRRLDVYLEGTKAISNLDLYAAAGAKDSAVTRTVTGVAVSGGVVNLRVQALADMPLISGFEITCRSGCGTTAVPTTPPASTPTTPAKRAWPTTWSTAPATPIARFEATATMVGSKIYVFGGFKDSDFRVHRTYSSYDIPTGVWTELGDLPAGMAETHLGAATDSRFIYLAGGLGGDYRQNRQDAQIASDQVWRYDTVTNTFALIATLPAKRAAGGLALIGRKLHWIGGIAADNFTDTPDHYILDLDTGDWSRGADFPELKDHFSTAVVGGKIYTLGGEFGHHELHQQKTSTHVYDPATDRWTVRASAPLAKSHDESATFVSDGKIVMAGGQTDGYKATSQVASYDPVANTWSTLTPLPQVRQGVIIQRYANRVVILSGAVATNAPLTTAWTGALD